MRETVIIGLVVCIAALLVELPKSAKAMFLQHEQRMADKLFRDEIAKAKKTHASHGVRVNESH